MSDIPEAVGSVVAGAAVARSVEPEHGEAPADRGHFAEQDCLNCGTPLEGPYCRQCGQAAHLHRTLGGFLHDLAHGVLHLDGKVWRTLPMIALRPGRLTRDYIEGHRARYVSPMALFLFSVFLMFAVFQLSGIVDPGPNEPGELATTTDAAGTIAIDDDGKGGGRVTIDKTGWAWLDGGLEHAAENPSLLLYKLKANSYKFSWLLVPLSVPFVWLLFAWKRRFGVYDHAVFVTYSLCFVTLFYVALWILSWTFIPGFLLLLAGLLVPPVHIYKQLRGAYELRRRSALWRLAALMVFIPIILGLFVQALLVIGLLG
ncbi:MAG TPA: DUF3667 domain-containing protein [Sphingomonadaceae bacterium]|nr:DUF3667 domain-containing protein [Sphingomonadaceae bacterium]